MTYQVGTINVTNNSATVVGIGTLFTGNVNVGDSLTVVLGIGLGTAYTIASVNSNTSITLTANYQGVTQSGVSYSIANDFTPNLNLVRLSKGDLETATYLTRNFDILDTQALNLTDANALYVNISGDTMAGDLVVGDVGALNDRAISVLSNTSYASGLEAYSSGNGNGYLFVGQSAVHGGGICYRGDVTSSSGVNFNALSVDNISIYRRDAGVNIEQIWFARTSSTTNMRGDLLTGNVASVSESNVFVKRAGSLVALKSENVRGILSTSTIHITIPNNIFTTVNFNNDTYDTDSMSSGTLIVVPTGVSFVRVSCFVMFNASIPHEVALIKNGGLFVGGVQSIITENTRTNGELISAIISVIPGDEFEVRIRQQTGSSQDVTGGPEGSWFSMEIIQ